MPKGRNEHKIYHGKRLKNIRVGFGYNRQRFGKMLGFTGDNIRRRMKLVEQGFRGLDTEKAARLTEFETYGLPDDAPEPNLARSTAAFWDRYNGGQPRVLELRRDADA